MLIALNKPYGYICQFSPHEKHPNLKELVNVPRVYPAGRLDTDSEGLLLLTEPVAALFIDFAFLGKPISALQWLGAAITLLAIYLGSLKSEKAA